MIRSWFGLVALVLLGSGCIQTAQTEETDAALRFHHPAGVAVNQGRVFLADRNNHRVLVWNEIPTGAEDAPDIVLGQPDFSHTTSGSRKKNMNWPTGVASALHKLVVADTYNDRILIWQTLPTKNRQKPDLILKEGVKWPWAVWTDGEKLIITSTIDSSVHIWKTFPEEDVPADLVLSLAEFGTPRSIGSDGERLVISDHNAKVDGKDTSGTFFWKRFPTQSDDSYDFFVASPNADPNGEVLWSPVFTDDGSLVALGQGMLYTWNQFPTEETAQDPDIALPIPSTGDSSGLAWNDGKLFASLNNANFLFVYEDLLSETNTEPLFKLGVDPYWITNPVPIVDGNRLYVTSGFDRTLSVWDEIPEDLTQPPDRVIELPFEAWDTFLWEGSLYLAGKSFVYTWDRVEDDVQILFEEKIGSAQLTALRGIARDASHFYLSDFEQNKVFVWEEFPDASDDPVFILDIPKPGRLSTDGEFLAVSSGTPGGAIYLYRIEDLEKSTAPAAVIPLSQDVPINLLQDVLIEEGKLFAAGTVDNVIVIWNSVEDAIAGDTPDDILGHIGTPGNKKGRYFWPAALDYEDGVLWIGEFKFSDRLLRYEF